jgi:hypothetical protein
MKRVSSYLRCLLSAIACVAGIAGSPLAGATALSDLAASMQPGTFAQLSGMINWNNGGILNPLSVAGCTTGDYITSYADKAPWDPLNKRLMFVGATHGNCYAGQFVLYTDSNSTWSVGPFPPGVCSSGTPTSPCFNHAYGHNTVDPSTGTLYYRQSYTSKFFKFSGGSWSTIPAPPMQDAQCCGALEFFPEMKKLLYLDGDWGLWAYDPSANSWTQLTNTSVANAISGLSNLTMPSTAVFAVYNSVQKIVLFGGGSNLYKINASGQVTTLHSPPVALGVTQAIESYDPVGGKFIVLSGNSMYQYDVSTDTWSQLAISVPQVLTAMLGVGDGLVETPVTSYGVIMYTKYDNSSSAVYLYKHSPTPAVQVKPDPPTSVKAQ